MILPDRSSFSGNVEIERLSLVIKMKVENEAKE
jgi:hypothetical protein